MSSEREEMGGGGERERERERERGRETERGVGDKYQSVPDLGLNPQPRYAP